MMAVFYCGTGAGDVGNFSSFLGIPGGKSREIKFSNHSPRMCSLITSIANGMMAKRLKAEIVATVFEKLQKAGY